MFNINIDDSKYFNKSTYINNIILLLLTQYKAQLPLSSAG